MIQQKLRFRSKDSKHVENNPRLFHEEFYYIESLLITKLKTLKMPKNVLYVYNPIQYAAGLHMQYLCKFLSGPKRVLFLGMHACPNGMGQTGIPFGNVTTVKNIMKLSAEVGQPDRTHPDRIINGLHCAIDELSGLKLWSLLVRLAGGSLTTFFQNCFVHVLCPFLFYDKYGHMVPITSLQGKYRINLIKICLNTLDQLITLVDPYIIIAIGDNIYSTLQKSAHNQLRKILKLEYPVLPFKAKKRANWERNAEMLFHEHNLIQYIQNDV